MTYLFTNPFGCVIFQITWLRLLGTSINSVHVKLLLKSIKSTITKETKAIYLDCPLTRTLHNSLIIPYMKNELLRLTCILRAKVSKEKWFMSELLSRLHLPDSIIELPSFCTLSWKSVQESKVLIANWILKMLELWFQPKCIKSSLLPSIQ